MQRYMSLPTVAVLAILVYIVFFGESSVTQRIEYQRQIDSLSAEVAVVQDSVDYYRELNRRLASEPEAMERVVREQYNMKREHAHNAPQTQVVAAVGREQTRRQHPQCACGVYPTHGAQHAESPRKQRQQRSHGYQQKPHRCRRLTQTRKFALLFHI